MIVYLVGMPGSGKTTIGKKLARQLKFSFVDLDKLIEEEIGKSITFLFEHYGENAFRKIERKMLLKNKNLTNTIISCGGGTPAFYKNMEFMCKNGITVYLNAPTNILISRITQAKKARPMLAAYDKSQLNEVLEKILHNRISYYQMALLSVTVPVKSLKTLAGMVFCQIKIKQIAVKNYLQ